MGYDLYGRGGYCGCPIWAWGDILGIARAFGWKPAGTTLPAEGPPEARGNPGPDWKRTCDEWGGHYHYNELQLVGDDDAKALAAALDSAIEAEKAGTLTKEQRTALDGPPSTSQLLQDLADFARHGEFRIG